MAGIINTLQNTGAGLLQGISNLVIGPPEPQPQTQPIPPSGTNPNLRATPTQQAGAAASTQQTPVFSSPSQNPFKSWDTDDYAKLEAMILDSGGDIQLIKSQVKIPSIQIYDLHRQKFEYQVDSDTTSEMNDLWLRSITLLMHIFPESFQDIINRFNPYTDPTAVLRLAEFAQLSVNEMSYFRRILQTARQKAASENSSVPREIQNLYPTKGALSISTWMPVYKASSNYLNGKPFDSPLAKPRSGFYNPQNPHAKSVLTAYPNYRAALSPKPPLSSSPPSSSSAPSSSSSSSSSSAPPKSSAPPPINTHYSAYPKFWKAIFQSIQDEPLFESLQETYTQSELDRTWPRIAEHYRGVYSNPAEAVHVTPFPLADAHGRYSIPPNPLTSRTRNNYAPKKRSKKEKY